MPPAPGPAPPVALDNHLPQKYPVAVEAEELRKRHGGTEAVRGLNLTVPAGTIHGLPCPNEAGKTTTVNILATLHARTASTASRDHGSCRPLSPDFDGTQHMGSCQPPIPLPQTIAVTPRRGSDPSHGGLDLRPAMFAPCLLGCPGTRRHHPASTGRRGCGRLDRMAAPGTC